MWLIALITALGCVPLGGVAVFLILNARLRGTPRSLDRCDVYCRDSRHCGSSVTSFKERYRLVAIDGAGNGSVPTPHRFLIQAPNASNAASENATYTS